MAERNLMVVDSDGELSELRPQLTMSPDKIQLLKDTLCVGATDNELELALAVIQRMQLDPFARQIAFIKRWNGELKREVITPQVTIDGARLLAERTRKYGGQLGPWWCGQDGVWQDIWLSPGLPAAARVGVIRLDWREPLYAVARFDAYAAKKKDGELTAMWHRMPDIMIAKCFDEHTEVLTDKGFQRFAAVTGRVLQVTDSGLETTDARPFSQPWSGPMVTLDSDDLNFSVTPNHDMVTTEGKIEAGALFARARSRPHHWIPRCVSGTKPGAAMDDQTIKLAAAYLADGSDRSGGRFIIEVSRLAKVGALRSIGGFSSETERNVAGTTVQTRVRTITTRANKTAFVYQSSQIEALCDRGKRVRSDVLLTLSREQARLFVDTLIEFDGSVNRRTGVRRFYSSRPDLIETFEVAAVIAGYAVNPRTERDSDIGTRPNVWLTISARSEIPVVRWGREYNNLGANSTRKHTGLEMTTNQSGHVWCVTVPSGVIVVRRNGFSMLCGNCAEMLALRRAFPAELSGVYSDDEMGQATNIDPVPSVDVVDVRTGEIQRSRPVQGNDSKKAPTPLQEAKATLWREAQSKGLSKDLLDLYAEETCGEAPADMALSGIVQLTQKLKRENKDELLDRLTNRPVEVIDAPGDMFPDVEFGADSPDRFTR